MLVDAIRAETYRLFKNRTSLFWGVLFVPIIGVALSIVTFMVSRANEARLLDNLPPELRSSSSPLNLGEALLSAAANLANPVVLLFLLISAATIYAGDYRWETWRLTIARNSRPNLLVGKVVVVAALTLSAILALFLSDLVSSLIKALVFKRSLAFSLTGEQFADLVWMTLLSWARILQFTMLSLLAAVVTRSLLAALFAPLIIGVGQFFLPAILATMGVMPDGWVVPLAAPGIATDTLKAVIEGGPAVIGLPDQAVAKSLAGLALWTILPLIGAILWFQRQDLSKE